MTNLDSSDVTDEDFAKALKADEEAEAAAQLAVIRALVPLAKEQREHVLQAASAIAYADTCVPGVMAKVLEGMAERSTSTR